MSDRPSGQITMSTFGAALAVGGGDVAAEVTACCISGKHAAYRVPSHSRPASPTRADRPPSGPGWVHEIKHDGYRLICPSGRCRRPLASAGCVASHASSTVKW
jgi:hypothetical protein